MTDRILFKNRADAGVQLAQKLLLHKSKNPLVLALPRGGVPVGYEVVKKIHVPLDTLVVRKVGAPMNREYGVGALAPGDVVIFDEKTLISLGIEKKDLGPILSEEVQEMERRIKLYKSGAYTEGVRSDTIILVDDGLATGVTARAAIESAYLLYKPHKLIFATPICAQETARALESFADVICVQSVNNLIAIGNWYEDFSQTTDEEVITLLEKARN